MPINSQNITAVILAGGQGSRLGGVDKGLLELNKIPLVQHLINRIRPQVAGIIISANRNIKRYADLGFPVYEDEISDFAGPLAGILKALQQCKSEWLLTAPADSPFIPANLAQRLGKNIQNNKIVMAHDGKRLQPTFALIHKSLASSLEDFLQQGERKARVWMQQQPHKIVDFSDEANAFININTEDELKNAEKHFHAFMR
ncbi:MAG: molybdenum cofactor guanylyltransferase MobA [Gammaproteobacteria bacterium]|nr:MAG: molybdenum cofactor guanylyltransferase MobA [Gammaproteobacteria bacterium]